MKGLVGLVDFAVTGRMHLAIAALGMEVPVVALAYQGKFDGMMQRFDLGQMVFDPHTFDLDAMYACCARLLGRRGCQGGVAARTAGGDGVGACEFRRDSRALAPDRAANPRLTEFVGRPARRFANLEAAGTF